MHVATETESAQSLPEQELNDIARAVMKGTQFDSSVGNDTMQKEGGQSEGQDGSASGSAGLLAMSLRRVRDDAARQGAKRKLDNKKFTGVKSKVAGNAKILTKTNKKVLK